MLPDFLVRQENRNLLVLGLVIPEHFDDVSLVSLGLLGESDLVDVDEEEERETGASSDDHVAQEGEVEDTVLDAGEEDGTDSQHGEVGSVGKGVAQRVQLVSSGLADCQLRH